MKLFDKNEGLRKFVNIQYVKMKKVAAVGSMILLAINLALTVYPYVEHRFRQTYFGIIPGEYFGIPIVFLIIICLIMLGAHFYVKKLEMYRTEQMAEVMFNPYSVYALNPFQEMWFRHIDIPMLEGLVEVLPEGKKKEDMKKHLKVVYNWIKLGYIPKKDFPKELQKYYITKKQQRL